MTNDEWAKRRAGGCTENEGGIKIKSMIKTGSRYGESITR